MQVLVGKTKFLFQVQFALIDCLLIKIVLANSLFLCLKGIIRFFLFFKFYINFL